MTVIATLDEFKRTVDKVWAGISTSCAVCTDPDCLGYIWLLEEEEEPLLDAGVQIVQVNGESGPLFLDNYERDAQGRLVVNQRGPRCPWRGPDGRCTIHASRPLVCHMYPLGIERDGAGGYDWALHTDCHYVRSRTADQLAALLDGLRGVINNTAPTLIDLIVTAFAKSDSVAAEGTPLNRYLPVAPVEMPKRTR
ncbi:MAG TPA: hypothetical protein VE465_17195 [Streptosporangiaceae bacterium]|jgi:Fe-S-cluster containining protein|nr:hypothetical protein [Streptosporangiaceae bacterium]